MQTTKKLLLSILILSSRMNGIVDPNEMPDDGISKNKVSAVYQEVGSVLIKQAFALAVPTDHTFNAAREAFIRFNKERATDTICLTAKQFFGNEIDYFNALGAYAEAQKFLFLASFFYNKANEYDAENKTDLPQRIRELGVAAVLCMLDKLDAHNESIQNPKDLFTKKDKNGKSPIDQANDIFKVVGTGFKDRAEFVKEICAKHGGKPSVPQMFGDYFVNAK
jgi:hypothetical protein